MVDPGWAIRAERVDEHPLVDDVICDAFGASGEDVAALARRIRASVNYPSAFDELGYSESQ